MSNYDIAQLVEDLTVLGLLPKQAASSVDWNAAPYLNGGPLAGTRNRVVNGNFRVNSAGLSGTVTLAPGEFGHDKWYAGSGGCTYTFTPVIGGIELNISSGTLITEFFVDNGNYRLDWTGTSQVRSFHLPNPPSGAFGSQPQAFVAGEVTLGLEFNAGTLGFVQFEPRTSSGPGISTPFEHRLLRLEQLLAGLVPGGKATAPIEVPALNGGQLAGMRNKIINGKMEIAQRGTSFAAIANGVHTLDRYRSDYITTAVTTVSQQADAPPSNEFQNSLQVLVTTADASIAAGDFYLQSQTVEGFNVRDLIGQTFTVSFWVRSSKTGIHCVAFRNSAADRSYVAEYTVNAANTWEKKVITVAGGLITAGTWNWTSGAGLMVSWVLAAGSTFQTTADAWQTGNFLATSNQVNVLDTINNIFAITGVQLERGEIATPFEHRPYGIELALCQRYAVPMPLLIPMQAYGPTAAFGTWSAPVQMRALPSLSGGGYQIHDATGSPVSCTLNVTSMVGAAIRFDASATSGLVAGNVAMSLSPSGAYLSAEI